MAAESPLTLLVSSSDPAFNRRVQDELAARIGEWEETQYVSTARDLRPLQGGALLYLAPDDLESLADRTEQRVDWEYCDRSPMCVNFEDAPEFPTREELIGQIASTPNGQALEQLLGKPLGEWMQEQEEARGEEGAPGNSGGRLCTPEGNICATQAFLSGSASRLRFARQMLNRAESLLEAVREAHADDAPADLELAVSGRYRNTPMMRAQLDSDLQATALVSSVLLLLVLLIQFRDVRALLLLIGPLAVGLIVTLGVIAWLHPQLNLVSAFTLAVLAGIGIDFGIHLITYYGDFRDGSADGAEAIAQTMRKLISSLLAAGLTTGLAFAAVSASTFRGIAEMGWMAGLGVILSLLAYLLVFPPMTILLDRLRPQRGGLLREFGMRPRAPSKRSARIIVVAGLALAALGAFMAQGVEIERDIRNLRTPKVNANIVARDALGGTNGPVVYLLAESPEALRTAAEGLVR